MKMTVLNKYLGKEQKLTGKLFMVKKINGYWVSVVFEGHVLLKKFKTSFLMVIRIQFCDACYFFSTSSN